MNQNTDFDYEQFVQKKLETHPVGRTTNDLESALPDEADSERLTETLERLEEKTQVKQIGEKWRWMSFG